MYDSLSLPHPPSFDEADVSDKPTAIRRFPRLTVEAEASIVDEYRRQAEALLAVDDLVARVVDAVDASGEMGNTVIVFTSDNGYFHGEHRIPFGKGRAYESSIRVPLLARGPGFAAGRHVSEFVLNTDLPATIVPLAHATATRVLDGRSLMEPGPGRAILIETRNGFRGLRGGPHRLLEVDRARQR